MCSKTDVLKVLAILLLLIPLLLLAGCKADDPVLEITVTPTPTPAEKSSVMVFPDGSKIVLRPEANVEVIMLAGINPEISEIRVRLIQGEILVVPKLAPGNWFTVINPGGYIARIDGCAMVVSNSVVMGGNAVSGSFEVKCIAGRCEFGPDANHLFAVANNENGVSQVSFDGSSAGFDLEQLKAIYGLDFPDCTQYVPITGGEAPTPQPTQQVALQATPQPTTGSTSQPGLQPSVDFAATATQNCLDFQANFPSTPCP
jgi:hypothetical protein